jgi:hypothetical protein
LLNRILTQEFTVITNIDINVNINAHFSTAELFHDISVLLHTNSDHFAASFFLISSFTPFAELCTRYFFNLLGER